MQCDPRLIYSGIYPDGSKIKTTLCSNCGRIGLVVRYTGGQDISETFLTQTQGVEMAYALLRSVNRFNHATESPDSDVETPNETVIEL